MHIVAIGFAADERLLIVLDDGTVRAYTLLSPCPIKLADVGPSAPKLRPEGRDRANAHGYGLPIEATSNSYYVSYSLGPDAAETGVRDAQIWDGGVVCQTGTGAFVLWVAPGVAHTPSALHQPSTKIDPSYASIRTYPALPNVDDTRGSNSVASWCIHQPIRYSGPTAIHATDPEVLVSLSGQQTLYKLSLAYSDARDVNLDRGPFKAISVSPDGNLLALVTSKWEVWVVSYDFSRSLSEFDLAACDSFNSGVLSNTGEQHSLLPMSSKSSLASAGISQIAWCGSYTVAIAFTDQLIMIGPFGDSIQYYHRGTPYLHTELDGLRVVSTERHEFIAKVQGGFLVASSRTPGSADSQNPSR